MPEVFALFRTSSLDSKVRSLSFLNSKRSLRKTTPIMLWLPMCYSSLQWILKWGLAHLVKSCTPLKNGCSNVCSLFFRLSLNKHLLLSLHTSPFVCKSVPSLTTMACWQFPSPLEELWGRVSGLYLFLIFLDIVFYLAFCLSPSKDSFSALLLAHCSASMFLNFIFFISKDFSSAVI